MEYHNYDSKTGQYLGTEEADLSPMDLLLDPPQEIWLKPAHSTFVEPPEVSEGQMAVFDPETETWVVAIVAEPEAPPPDPLDLESQRTHALRAIDAQVDAVIRAVVGDRATEYLTAEYEANDYANRGYTGEVPLSVEDQVVATGVTPQQAADEILQASANWRGAQAQMRRARLVAKAAVRAAADVDGLTIALATWETQIRAIAAAVEE